MAEWVQKGSLMGPQGPKGEDATFPGGGTEGQFLKKTATGEEWGDVPAPDMSGYVKYSPEADKLTYDDGTEVSTIIVGDVNSGPYLQMSNNQVGIANRILNQSAGFGIHESSNHPALYLGANQGTTPKSVTGITDSISDSPEGLNLATDKAVADYVAANAGGGGLELLWEGTGSSLVSISGYTLTDYALIYIVFVASGNFYIGACRPDGNTYSESGYRMSVNISGTYANSVSVTNPAQARAVYGLKASGGGVAPEPTYQLDNKGEISYHKSGEVLVIANGTLKGEICLYQKDTEEPVGDIYTDKSVSSFPDFVQEKFASQPSTLAPPPTSDGYAWAIMPPCDCYVYYA